LPPRRRLLATFNWRPVYDIEMRELESVRRTQQIEKEIEQLDTENRRLAALNSRRMPCCSMLIPPLRFRPQPAPPE